MTPIEVFHAALIWSATTQIATVDMSIAREIHRNNLRVRRAPLFIANDLTIRDAMLDDDTKRLQPALKRRDELRDVTIYTPIKAAETLEELLAAIPKILTD